MTPLASPRARTSWTAGPAGLPRVLWGLHRGDDVSLPAHRELFGPLPVLRADDLIDATAHAALRGRGGAGFPTATKLRAVADGRRPRVVVANGAEGEPASGKDELLLTRSPHAVLDGLMLAAVALEANQAIIAVERTRPRALRAVTTAVAERAAAGLDPVAIQVVPVPGRYVAGEESALVHLLNGGEAKPTFVPPRPFERGVGGRPTLIQNVETLVHLALIARHGPEWFRTVGTPDEPGSTLLTVGGAVARPSVFEVALGSRFDSLITAAGGETEPVSAYLVGGYFGTWVRRDDLWERRLSATDLRLVGASLGAGIVTALPQSVCGLVETARVMRYLSEETAGQCGSCVNGLAAIADRVDTVGAGSLDPDDARRAGPMVGDGRGTRRVPAPRRSGSVPAQRTSRLRQGSRLPPERSLQRDAPRDLPPDPTRRARLGLAMTARLRLDPIRCDGHGICAELFPEGISLDDWGFPILDPEPISRELLDHARRAVFACPVLALKIVNDR